jgi:hypothetical protein
MFKTLAIAGLVSMSQAYSQSYKASAYDAPAYGYPTRKAAPAYKANSYHAYSDEGSENGSGNSNGYGHGKSGRGSSNGNGRG